MLLELAFIDPTIRQAGSKEEDYRFYIIEDAAAPGGLTQRVS